MEENPDIIGNDDDVDFVNFDSRLSQNSADNKTLSSSYSRQKSSSTKASKSTEELNQRLKKVTSSLTKKRASPKVGRRKKNDDGKIYKSKSREKLLKKEVKNILAPKKKCKDLKELNMTSYLIKKTKFPNPCWYCRRNFDTPANCVEHTKQEHMSITTSLNPIVCGRCSKICFNESTLLVHMKKCEQIPSGEILPKTLQCPHPECPKLFALDFMLKSHAAWHSSENPYVCDECPYRTKNVSLLNRHKSNKHSVEGTEQKIQCDECQIFVKNLHYHKINMHTTEGYQKYRERQKAVLARQKTERRAKSVPLSTICADCNVDFFSRLALINHRRTIHADNMGKEWVCDLCGRDFTTQGSLKSHTKRVHSDERPFICEVCGKRFKVNYNLIAHVQERHTEEGRIKYNAQRRERDRRKRVRAKQLENVKQQQQQQQQQQIRVPIEVTAGAAVFADF